MTRNNPDVIDRLTTTLHWEWRVEYQYKHWSMSQEYYDWRHNHQIFRRREPARQLVQILKGCEDFRNIVLKRRIVQRNWTEYS